MLQTVVQSISPYQNILMNYFFGAEIDEIDSPLKSPNPRTFFLRGFFQQTLENAVRDEVIKKRSKGKAD
jgi:hypothetical protein